MFTSAAPTTQTVNAGFETANQTTEASKFQNYQTGAHINTQTTNANTGSNSLYLNGGYSGQVGVTKSYAVFPGDKLQIQAYAKYNTPTGTPSNLTGFAAALLSAFVLPTPVAGETGTPASAINTWGGIEAGGYGDGSSDNTDPRVFVTIVLFDKNHKFLDVTYDQLKTSGALMSASYTVKEAGFAYLYVSNENANLVDVYFDDVMMSYTPTNIIQNNEYYAHSMPTANSWTRDNTTNNFLGNGGTELNATTQLYDLAYRNYDATLGRFQQVDPLTSRFASQTPYNYAFNNPVLLNDPLGNKPQPEIIQDNQYISRPNALDRSDNYDTGGGYYEMLSDANTMSTDEFAAKYGAEITNPNTIRTIVNNYNNLVVARYTVEITEYGVTYGYNIDVNRANNPVLVDKVNLATNEVIHLDFGGTNGVVYGTLTSGEGGSFWDRISIEGDVSMGAQGGFNANHFLEGVLNVASFRLFGFSAGKENKLLGGPDKKGVPIKQGASIGLGGFSYGVERQFTGKNYGTEGLTDKASVTFPVIPLLVNGFQETEIGPGGKSVDRSGFSFDVSGGLIIMGSLSIKVYID